MFFSRQSLPGGVSLFLAQTAKFKTTTLVAHWHCDLGRTPTENALLPFLLRRATRFFPSVRALNRRFEDLYGSECAVGVGKLGERQILSFRLEVPAEEYLPDEGVLAQAAAALADLIRQPLLDGEGSFCRDYLDREKVNSKVRLEAVFNDKAAYARMRCVQEMCRNERYAVHQYGRKDDLPGITGAGLYTRYREILRDSPLTVFLVGKLDPEGAAGLVGERFTWPEREVGDVRSTELRAAGGEWREVTETQRVEQAKICLGYRTGIGRGDERFWALAMANGILGGFPHAKLFRKVREEAGLAYSVSSSLEASKGLLFVDAGIAAEDYGRAREIIEHQLADVQKGYFSDEEMEKARAGMLRALRSRLDQPRAFIAAHLEGLVNGREEEPANAEGRIRALSRDEVVEAAAGIRGDTAYFLRGGAA